MTQSNVASMLKTTQQTVARWESGKAKPSVPALRDLATIFSTSVDDLLGLNPFSERAVTNSYYLLHQEEDGFWGHLGLLVPGNANSAWYPITSAERSRVWQFLRSNEETDWIVVTTLNNRILAFRPAELDRVWLLDDACDEPSDDWQWKTAWDDYSGLPREVYRAMSEWAADQTDGFGDFLENNSGTLQEIVLQTVREAGLEDNPERVLQIIHDTIIWTTTGKSYEYEVEPAELWSAIQDLEGDFIEQVYLPKVGGDFESFFPTKKISLIDMPLLSVDNAAQSALKELESG